MNPLTRWPYLTAITLTVTEAVCWWWLFTHMACAHPIGNGIAALTAFILIPLAIMTMIDHTELPPAQLPSTTHIAGAAGGDKASR
ncbi:hypothetical protein JS533_007570 [Bifidobacterium amazonense]|uniref:Uncharacterized protein n=1 Tax=Bifidobacterium amazonense TaxID=2809027 RepID=A0ABS9VVN1_9BIFI|nr:hypothetical protein [Bifidobacterium amazonense]MCH9276127.1 hypothetical protein [Bifidobacterium amazonense]